LEETSIAKMKMDNKILMSRACAGFLSIFVEGTFGGINPSKTHEL